VENQNKKRLKAKDFIIMAVYIFIAAFIAFTYLGGTEVPVTSVDGREEWNIKIIDIDTGDFRAEYIWTYIGIGRAVISVDCLDSEGGSRVSRETIDVSYGNMYRWETFKLEKGSTRYIRLRVVSYAEIFEVTLSDSDGVKCPITILDCTEGAEVYLDEQALVPDNPSLLNGMYFDELYHARTALEFIRGDEAYETTHPPLGKIIISWGIKLFGMNPFGWRFMDALFSVLLIPLFYYFLFRICKSTAWSTAGTALFVIDGMRIVMGRIATLDTFSTFFVTAAFLFMYIFSENMLNGTRWYKWAIPLAISGIIWGIACAVKWTGIYAGAGLFVVFVYTVIRWIFDYSDELNKRIVIDKKVLIRIGSLFTICLIFFIAIPFITYLASYIPFKRGLDSEGSTATLLQVMWDNQKLMYSYHSELTAPHPYGSRWYIWLFNGKPVYFYLGEDFLAPAITAKIFAFGNYVVWIIGFIILVMSFSKCIAEAARTKVNNAYYPEGYKKKRRKFLFLLIFYLSMLVPWLFISRVAFMYHYYGCIPPLIAITVLFLKDNWNKGKIPYKSGSHVYKLPIVCSDGSLLMGRVYTVIFFIAAIVAFLLCYPLYTGIPVNWPIFYPF
jgi:dolichyl-phosphate-mannose--protein O-mannosyl transferase